MKINHVTEGLAADIYLKCEFFNPLASVKDRIGKAMIEAAEAAGKIGPDSISLSRLPATLVLHLHSFVRPRATS